MIRTELPVGIIAVLKYANPGDIENIADSWKMSSDEKKLLVAARNFIDVYSGISADMMLVCIRDEIILKKLPLEFGYTILSYFDMLYRVDKFHEMYDAIPEKMPFDGNDVMDAGFKGKVVGEILGRVQMFWIENEFPDRKRLYQYFNQIVEDYLD